MALPSYQRPPAFTYDDLDARTHLRRKLVDWANGLVDFIDQRFGIVTRDTDYHECVVPGCMVLSRRLEAGVCPPHLWDERHERFVAEHA